VLDLFVCWCGSTRPPKRHTACQRPYVCFVIHFRNDVMNTQVMIMIKLEPYDENMTLKRID